MKEEYQIIEVDGEEIEVPLSMSDEEIVAAIEKAKGIVKPKAPSGLRQGFLDPFQGAAQLVGKGLEAAGIDYGKDVVDYYTQAQQEYAKQREASGETGFDWARVGGNVVSPVNLALGGIGGAAAKAANPLVVAAGTGAAAGVVSPVENSNKDFTEQKVQQIVTGAATGAAGEKVASAAGRVFNPLISKAEQRMRDLGVTLTPGESIGGWAKSMEEFAQNLPLIGGRIKGARQKSLYDFNKGVISKPLEKLKGISNNIQTALPEDVIGRDAVDFAAKQVDAAYDSILLNPSFKVRLGATEKNQLRAAAYSTTGLSKEMRKSVDDELNALVFSRFGNKELTGDLYKGIESDLSKRSLSLQNSATDADRQKGEALYKAYKELKKSMYKQNPVDAPKLRRVDSAYRDLSIIDTATGDLRSKNGVITPSAYASAVRDNDITRGKKAWARGRTGAGRDADAAIEILGDETNDIVQGRLALQLGSAAGVGWAGSQDLATTGGVATAIYGLYSPAARKAIDVLVAKRYDFLKEFGKLIQEKAATQGAITGQEIAEAYSRSKEVKREE